jgi:hypothetical protein
MTSGRNRPRSLTGRQTAALPGASGGIIGQPASFGPWLVAVEAWRGRHMSIRLPAPAVAVVSVAAASAGIAANAVLTDRPEGQDLWTYYLNQWWWAAAWLLVIPVFLAAARWRGVAGPLVLGASAPQWVVVLVHTFDVNGLFHANAVIVAVTMTCAFALAAYLGSAGLRRKHDVGWSAPPSP